MTRETFNQLSRDNKLKKDNNFKHLISFIYGLIGANINLKYIDVNDWQTNTDPSIYIHNKKNLFDIRGYKRTSNFDLLNAIRFYNK